MANRKSTAWLSEIFCLFFPSLLLILVDHVVMVFLFATPNSLVPCALLLCILCPSSYIPSPLTSLAEVLWWPWELLPPGMPEAWEYLLLFPCLIPQHWHLKAVAGPPSIMFSSSLHLSGEWSFEAWKRDGNHKAMLSPADPHETSQCPQLPYCFILFLLAPCSVPSTSISTLGNQSLSWSDYAFSHLFFLNLNKLCLFHIDKKTL